MDNIPVNDKTFSVVIVEDEEHTRDFIAELVSSFDSVRVSAAVSSAAAGLRALEDKPDILLCDLGLPDADGVSVIAEAARRDIAAMVISFFDDEQTVLRAIQAGASGYLLKDQNRQALRQAIADLLAGGSPITPSIAGYLLRRLSSSVDNKIDQDDATIERLSARESEILKLAAQGYTSKEIAKTLCLSPYTVANHLRNVYRKLSVKSKAEAVAFAISKRLI